MKTKITAIFSILLLFTFLSCSNSIEEREENNTSDYVSVSFNFGNSRAAMSIAKPEDYTYTLDYFYLRDSYIKDNFYIQTRFDEVTLCEKLSYSEFLSKKFKIKTGVDNFRIYAYKGDSQVYAGASQVTVDSSTTSISLTLNPITGGFGGVRIELEYPEDKDITRITAGLYDYVISDDNGTELSLNPSTSSVVFEAASVPCGVSKFVKFYLYNSQDICIGTFLENVFVVKDDLVSVKEKIEYVNSYAATVYLTVQDKPWNNSGCTIKAQSGSYVYTFNATNGTNAYTANLPVGVYDIYKNGEDTGVNLTVSAIGDSGATVNIPVSGYVTTAANIAQVISSLSGEITDVKTIVILGELTESDITTIKEEIQKTSYPINLDLSNTYGLEELPGSAFRDCTSLKSIEIPSSVTSIGVEAFGSCENLRSIEIPSSVNLIGNSAFKGCTSLETIEIPSSVTSIGDYTFYNCTSLASVKIPSSVTSIGSGAFQYCRSLVPIEIPSSVISIGTYAFNSCYALETIEIPSSVVLIDRCTFTGCIKLKDIIFEDPDNWYCKLYNSVETELVDLSVSSVNTEYFLNTYKDYSWIKKDQ